MLSQEIKKNIIIRSGGQTGVDRAALDFAIKNDLNYTGYCPKDGWAEDKETPPGLLKQYKKLIETDSKLPEKRTILNVINSDITIIIKSNNLDDSKGTDLTVKTAIENAKQYIIINIDDNDAILKISEFIHNNYNKKKYDVNFAGPRESEDPGIYLKTFASLNKII